MGLQLLILEPPRERTWGTPWDISSKESFTKAKGKLSGIYNFNSGVSMASEGLRVLHGAGLALSWHWGELNRSPGGLPYGGVPFGWMIRM